jgi:hypothetical protein
LCKEITADNTNMFSYGGTDIDLKTAMGIGWKFVITLRGLSFVGYLIILMLSVSGVQHQWRDFISNFLILFQKKDDTNCSNCTIGYGAVNNR